MPWRWILLVGGFLVAVLYVLGGYFGVPALARKAWIPEINERIAGELKVRAVRFDPFLFVLRMDDVALSGPAGERVVWARGMEVRAGPLNLFRGAMDLREVRLDQPEFEIELVDGEKPALARALEPVEPDGAEGFSIQRIVVADATLEFRASDGAWPFERRFEQLSFSVAALEEEGGASRLFSLSTVSASGERLSLEGGLRLEPLSFDGRLEIEGLRAQDLARWIGAGWNFELVHGIVDLGFDCRLDLERGLGGITTGKGSARVQDLVLRSRDRDEPFSAVESAVLEGLQMDPARRSLVVDSISVAGGRHVLEREPDGGLNLLRYFAGGREETGQLASGGWRVQVERLELEGQSLRWIDALRSGPVDLSFEDVKAVIENLGGPRDGRTEFSVSARLGPYGGVSLEGEYLADSAEVAVVAGFDRLPAGIPADYLELAPRIAISTGFLGGRLEVGAAVENESVSVDWIRGEGRVSAFAARAESGDSINWELLLVRGLDWARDSGESLKVGSVRLQGAELGIVSGFQEGVRSLPQAEITSFEVSDSRIVPLAEDGAPLPFSFGFDGAGSGLRFGGAGRGEFAGRFELEGVPSGRGTFNLVLDGTGESLLEFEAVELAAESLSGWLRPVTGRAFKDGLVDLKCRMTGVGPRFNGTSELVFSSLLEAGVGGDGAARESAWDYARAFLEDRQGIWRLDVPFALDLAEASVSPSDSLRLALGSVIADVAEDPDEAAAAVFGGTIPPPVREVRFPPGAYSLDSETLAELALYEAILKDRPRLCLNMHVELDPQADGSALQAVAWEALLAPELEEAVSRDKAILRLHEKYFPGEKRFFLLRLFGIFASGSAKGTGKTVEEMEWALLQMLSPGPDEFTELAGRRAGVVADAVLSESDLDPARVQVPDIRPADFDGTAGNTGTVELVLMPCP